MTPVASLTTKVIEIKHWPEALAKLKLLTYL